MECQMGMRGFRLSPKDVLFQIWDILSIVTPLALNVFVYNVIQHSISMNRLRIYQRFIIEIIAIILPVVLVLTFHGWSNEILLFYSAIVTAISFFMPNKKLSNSKVVDECYFSIYWSRVLIFLITAVTILAVDFNEFPDSMKKTDFIGISLMDTGIGYFIFCVGIVNKCQEIKKSNWKAFYLIMIGALRCLAITLFNYHQSPLEYGTHWNAFLTIGFTQFFGNYIAYSLKKYKFIFIFGALLAVVHEVVLEKFLFIYVMDPEGPRDNFITANREGLISLIGFVAFYLICTSISFKMSELKAKHSQNALFYITRIFFLTIICFIILFTLQILFYSNIARRVANLQYICFMLFLCMYTMFMTLLVGYLSRGLQIDFDNQIISNQISFKALIFFLVTNILTGIANMLFDLKQFEILEMIITLSCYMILSCLVTMLWSNTNIYNTLIYKTKNL